MKIGKLRDRIDLLEKTEATNQRGRTSATWSPFASRLPAERLSVTAGESDAQQQTRTTQSETWRIRYIAGVTSAHRFTATSDGLTREITAAVDPDQRRRQLLITATVRTSD